MLLFVQIMFKEDFVYMFFNKNSDEKNSLFQSARHKHELWKNNLYEMNKPFFMLPTDFSNLFLKDISGGALKLYLFLGFHSKYKSGETWYSIEQISLFFEKDSRTIAKWFKELEDLNLIFRGQKGFMMTANTFLKPYGYFVDTNNVYVRKSIEQIEYFIQHLNKDADFTQGIVMNHGISETNLILIKKSSDDPNMYDINAFLDIEYEYIKKIKQLFKKKNIPLDTMDIAQSILESKTLSQTLYTNVIKFFDEERMWL